MKKSIFKISLLVALPLTVFLSSCSKDDETKNEPIALGQTVVYGRVTADLTLNNGVLETAPAGTKINAWIEGSDLVLNPLYTVNYPRKYYTTTVDANGNYSLVIEAGSKAVTVHIDPATFEYNQTLENGEKKVVNYKTTGITKVGYNGQSQRQDFDYTYALQTGSEVGLATIKGNVYYKYDMCKGNGENLGGYDTQAVAAPNGTIIIATWTDDNNVARSLEVPVQNGQISFTIETKKTGASSTQVTLNGRAFYEKRKSRTSGTCDIEPEDYKYTLTAISDFVKKGETTIFKEGTVIKFR